LDVNDCESIGEAHRASLSADLSRPAGTPAGVSNSAA